MSTFLEIKI